jgi:hypothetical protein
MASSKTELVVELGRLAGMTVADDEIGEVANRLNALLRELESLDSLDLSSIQPVTTFPEESDDGE